MQLQDRRKPTVKLRNTVKGLALGPASAMGVLRRTPASAQRRKAGVAVQYFGDTLNYDGPTRMHEQRLVEFETPRPLFETRANVFYSPSGMAWVDGALHQAYSVRMPSLLEILRRPKAKAAVIDEAVIVECDYPYTYGDWVQTYLGTVLCAEPLGAPLLLPAFLAKKDYVARDLKRANIDYIVADEWRCIRRAKILRKQTPLLYWTEREVDAYRAKLAPVRPEPEPGSITYLGRFDFVGEAATRQYPSEVVATIVTKLGGRVLRPEDLSSDKAATHARYTETVIADHGSAVANILHWRPKNVIELFLNDWWPNNNLFLAHHCGAQNIGAVRVDGRSPEDIEWRIRACLDHFGTPQNLKPNEKGELSRDAAPVD